MGHRQDDEKLAQYLFQDQHEEVRHLLHTMKGMAANIGATGLEASTIRLEKMIGSYGTEEWTQAHQEFVMALQECCEEAQSLVQSLTVEVLTIETKEQFMGATDMEEILSRLLQLIADGDCQGKSYFLEHRQKLAGQLSKDEYQQLEQTIVNYNLEDALVVLQNIIAKGGKRS